MEVHLLPGWGTPAPLKRCGAFITHATGTPDVSIEELAERPGSPPFMDYQRIQLWVRDGRFGFQAPLDAHHRAARLDHTLDTLLRVSLAHHLGTHQGVLLHSSGWVRPEGALVFFGESGAGKTTTVKRCPDAEYMCDEAMALRKEAGRWTAFGTPFSGADPRPTVPRQGALLAACSLVKAPGTKGWVKRLDAATATQRVMRCAMLHAVHKDAVAGLFSTAASLVLDGMVVEMGLPRGGDPWELWQAWTEVGHGATA